MRIGLNGTQDMMALLVRRKWWVVAPFLALSCLVAVLTYVLPRTYVSDVLILVRPRDVPQEFVKDLITGTPEERLKSIEQTLLSRTNLVQILREFSDRLPEFSGLNMDEQVLKLRGQISIFFELEKTNGKILPLTYFKISYQNQNPELAQKIAAKLTALFIEQDNRVRENQVFGTTEFLATEVNKVAEQLTQSQEKLKQIKSRRLFELPDQRDANLRTLDRLAQDRKTNAEALDRYASILLTLETQISQTPETVPRTVAPSVPSVKKLQLEEYRKAQVAYEEVATKYTAKHPEVQALKALVERLKKQIPPEVLAAETADAESTSAGDASNNSTEPNPLYQKLIIQRDQLKLEMEIRQKEKGWIESEIARYSRRVENAPNAEQDIADAARQNEEYKKQYETLKSNLAQARMAESLESKQKGSQFVVVDPANYPLMPAKPNKIAVFLGGTLLTLALSIGFATVVDVARQKIWTQSQVEAFWGVPVLVDIPAIVTASDLALQRRRKIRHTAYSVAAGFVWSLFLYALYVKHEFVLQQLDPVIQKLIYK
jgi:succinoglycan biosynthesis transport protein ExoP